MKLSKATKRDLARLVPVRRAAELAGVAESVIRANVSLGKLEALMIPSSVDMDDVRRVISQRGRGRPRISKTVNGLGS